MRKAFPRGGAAQDATRRACACAVPADACGRCTYFWWWLVGEQGAGGLAWLCQVRLRQRGAQSSSKSARRKSAWRKSGWSKSGWRKSGWRIAHPELRTPIAGLPAIYLPPVGGGHQAHPSCHYCLLSMDYLPVYMPLYCYPAHSCIYCCSPEQWSQVARMSDRHRSVSLPLVPSFPRPPSHHCLWCDVAPVRAGVSMMTSTPNCRGGHGPVFTTGCRLSQMVVICPRTQVSDPWTAQVLPVQ